jgi:hypothetical protein
MLGKHFGLRPTLSRLLSFLGWPGEIGDLIWLPYIAAALILGVVGFVFYAGIYIYCASAKTGGEIFALSGYPPLRST